MLRTYPVDVSIKTSTQSLLRDWKELNKAYHHFAITKLKFAQQVASIWAKAKELDNVKSGEANQNHFREHLHQIIKSDDKSILSKWVGIGSNAKALLPFAESLPAQRDSLYALATAIQRKRPVQKWISSGKLSSESTVRDVFVLTSAKNKSKLNARKQRNVTVTLELSGDYTGAASLLVPLLFQDELVVMKSDKAFTSALKDQLGKEQFNVIAEKVK